MSASRNRSAGSGRWWLAGRGGWLSALLLSVALLAGCGSGSSGSSTSAQTPTSSAGPTGAAPGGTTGSTGSVTGSTGSAPATAAGASKGASTAHSGQSTRSGASTATPTPSLPTGGHVLHRYAGSGNARLGTIVAGSQVVLVWRAQHPPIQIFTSKGFILVNGGAAAGSIHLSQGAYAGTRVATRGGWSVELRARSR